MRGRRNTPTLNDNSLLGQRLVAKVSLHNYRYPKNKAAVSGEYAIVILDVLEVLEGQLDASCRINTGGIVVTGNMPRLDYDMEYIFQGVLKMDEKWGPQYECETIRLAYDMTNPEDQRKFFSFFMSDLQINSLFEMYSNPLEILEQKNIGALTKIKGIGPATAKRICQKYTENIDNGRAYVELKDLGLTKHAIDKLITQFGSADIVVDLILSNPYSLIHLVKGYGWERADQIALKQGFGRGCKKRCLAYAQYKLEKLANEDGNSRTAIDPFLDDIANMCAPTPKSQLASWIKETMVGESDFDQWYQRVVSGEKDLILPKFFYAKENRCVGLFSLRLLEKRIANQLSRLKNAFFDTVFDHDLCDNIIQSVEKEQGYTYTAEQKRAIWNVLNSNVVVLTGRAGTGKSSTLKPLIRIFNHYHKTVAQCALSGRAASLLTEYTGLEGKTIHRLLHYVPELESFTHNANNPLPYDVIILDETSMVGEELFLSLISSIRSGAKLILLGDIKQLPPMSVGNILNDCIQSGFIPTTVLTIIQRQALASGIISESNSVCEGKSIVKSDFEGEDIRGSLKDFKLVAHADATVMHGSVIDEFKKLYIDRRIPVEDIQIVVPVRAKGMNSCRYFNTEIQNIVNGSNNKKSVTVSVVDGGQRFDVTYKVDDRIIVTKNNYHAKSLSGSEVAIFNGNMGHIVDLNKEKMIIAINDGDVVSIPREEWNDISLSYACTCHKLQGSQSPYVIISLDSGAYPLLMREWLYTALTRARKYCILIGQPKAINTATRVSNLKVKQTWLKDDLTLLYRAEHGLS